MSRPRAITRRTVLKTAAGGAALALGGGWPNRAPGQTRKHPVTLWAHFAGRNYEILTRLVGEFNQATPDVEVKTTSYGPAEISRRGMTGGRGRSARASSSRSSRPTSWRPACAA